MDGFEKIFRFAQDDAVGMSKTSLKSLNAGYKNVTRRHDGVYGGVDGCSREWGVVDES